MKTLKMIFRTMKKYTFIFAALSVMAAGCAKEAQIAEKEAETPEETSSVVFTAGIDTKAHLDGTALKWDASDEITIWNGTSAVAFTTSDNGPTATFTTTADFSSAASYVALYPADADATFTATSVTTTLPADQTATAGTFDPAAGLATAKTDNTTLSFSNLVSYLKFTVPAGMDDLTSISFKGNAGEKVAGAATVNVEAKTLTATDSETATLSGTFVAGETYYMAIAPQAFTAGYTVTITRTSGTYDMVSGKNVTFSRSKARNIGELWDGSYIITGTALDAPVTATKTVGPRTNSNATLKEYTYGFSGNLKAGTVSVKKAYSSTAAATATVPADGWYHLFYNETTDTFKLYSQELSVNFGSSIDGVNSIDAFAEGSFAELYDYNLDAESSVKVTVGAGFTGTYSNGYYTNNPSWEFYLDDCYFRSQILYSNIIISKTRNTGDTDPATITISGLNPLSKYDIKVSGGRGGGSLTARKTQITIGGTSLTYNQGLDGTGSKPATSVEFRKNNVASFENLTPNDTGVITITIIGIDTTTACEAHIGCIFVSRVVE